MGERERDSFLCKEDKMALEVDSPGIVGDGRPREAAPRKDSSLGDKDHVGILHGTDQNQNPL